MKKIILAAALILMTAQAFTQDDEQRFRLTELKSTIEGVEEVFPVDGFIIVSNDLITIITSGQYPDKYHAFSKWYETDSEKFTGLCTQVIDENNMVFDFLFFTPKSDEYYYMFVIRVNDENSLILYGVEL